MSSPTSPYLHYALWIYSIILGILFGGVWYIKIDSKEQPTPECVDFMFVETGKYDCTYGEDGVIEKCEAVTDIKCTKWEKRFSSLPDGVKSSSSGYYLFDNVHDFYHSSSSGGDLIDLHPIPSPSSL